MAKHEYSGTATVEPLVRLLAETYTLMLKTQNYHWNVEGPLFYTLHNLFEDQYKDLFEAVDEIAERIRALGSTAPGGLVAFRELAEIQDGSSTLSAGQMVEDLLEDHAHVVELIAEVGETADDEDDSATESMMDDRMAAHQKMMWMLRSIVHQAPPAPVPAQESDSDGAADNVMLEPSEKKKKKAKN